LGTCLYLHYQNRRPDYIEAFFNVINWTEVSRRFASEKISKYKLELGGTKRMANSNRIKIKSRMNYSLYDFLIV
jgi:hypothetical protein